MFGPSRRDLLRLIERERVQHRVEVAHLLDRLADQAGRPWTPSPADVTPREPAEVVPRTWTATPEQELFYEVQEEA